MLEPKKFVMMMMVMIQLLICKKTDLKVPALTEAQRSGSGRWPLG